MNENRESRRTIEHKIFNDSFALIDKYVEGYKGLQEAYKKEYKYALINKNGLLDWHKVLPKLPKSSYRESYLNAIRTIGPLVKSARKNHRKSGGSEADNKLFESLAQNVTLLIEKRTEELKPTLSIMGWSLWKGEKYKSHEQVIQVWNQFSSDIQYQPFVEFFKDLLGYFGF